MTCITQPAKLEFKILIDNYKKKLLSKLINLNIKQSDL